MSSSNGASEQHVWNPSRCCKIYNSEEKSPCENGKKYRCLGEYIKIYCEGFLEIIIRIIILVKWKQSGKVNFFRKKSKNTVRCSFWFWVEWWYFRLSSAIWWWVMAIWKFEICATPTAYAKIFLENFFVSIGRVKNSTCTAQVFIDFHYYNDLE